MIVLLAGSACFGMVSMVCLVGLIWFVCFGMVYCLVGLVWFVCYFGSQSTTQHLPCRVYKILGMVCLVGFVW